MSKHLIHHDQPQPVGAVLFPLGLPLQEQLYIHDPLSFSYQPTFPGCPPFGSYSLTSLVLNIFLPLICGIYGKQRNKIHNQNE